MERKTALVVVVVLLVVVTVGLAGCSALDPCVRERDACYDRCPTVVGAKQVCREVCNLEYDQCRSK